ncbi:hypothetical protein PROFUN_09705 [Planoprotostelium fungivorum]|uniref:Uncharacterized protein n=1 Tax=Planoprotostelium fungivorum TaxID=1890364 RepID=A0A2P6NET4_9EUKA|nr:hypothetical protein PROFUN_09705 [Planoprotostelium fungivorum]
MGQTSCAARLPGGRRKRRVARCSLTSTVVTSGGNSKFVTVHNLTVVNTISTSYYAPPLVLELQGNQILHLNTTFIGGGDYWPLSTGSPISRGPIVHHNIDILAGPGARVSPHMRWSTAHLYDNVRNRGSTICLNYRSNYGTGHGWTMAWGIIWNSQAATLCAQNPYNYYLNDPSASQRSYYHNWLVGGNGTNIPGDFMTTLTGTYDSVGVTVEPQSLYLAQMAQKTGTVSSSGSTVTSTLETKNTDVPITISHVSGGSRRGTEWLSTACLVVLVAVIVMM